MKRSATIVLAALIVLGGGWAAIRGMLNAIDRGSCKRSAADIRSIVTAIEAYKQDHGSYPVAMYTSQLQKALEPDYIRVVPADGVDYFSDGEAVAILLRWGRDGPSDPICVYEYRDGRFVAWPEFLREAPREW